MSDEISKPEWFQMAEADAFEPRPKAKRRFRTVALAAPLFVLGAGAVYAQSQDGPSASASSVVSSASAVSSTAPSQASTSQTPSSPASAVQQATPVSAAPASQTTHATSVSSLAAKPAIAKPGIQKPTGEGERSSDDD